MSGIYTYIIDQLNNNEIFSGIIGGSIFTFILYQLRSFPSRVYNIFKMIFVSHLNLVSTDSRFNFFLEYFQKNEPILRRSRYSLIFSGYNGYTETGRDDNSYKLGIGYGLHFYKIKGRLVSLNYFIDEKQSMHPVERIEVRFLSRKPQELIKYIFDKVKETSRNDEIDVYVNERNFWRQTKGVLKRSEESIFINDGIKNDVFMKIDKFLSNRKFCLDKGIQWKKSFLFDGPTGTGKSSLCMAIASKYDMPVYFLSLGAVKGDYDLQGLFSTIPKESIVLIEDVDCAKREDFNENKSKEDKTITTSCLLNCLDGIMTPTGRLLLMTTNHYDKLDSALVRAGRVDHRYTIDKMDMKTASRMFHYLAPELNANDFDLEGKTGAEIENIVKSI